MKTALVLLFASLASIAPVQAGPGPMVAAKNQAANALNNLRNNATADKGGHRIAAIKHLEAAIAEIEAGIAFDRENLAKGEGKKGKNKN